MSRPVLVDIPNGVEGWDEEFNANLALLRDGPFPVFRYPTNWATTKTFAQLETAFPAANYEECLVVLRETTIGAVVCYSDGTRWRAMGKGKVVALTDAATVTVDADDIGDRGMGYFTIGGNRTLGAPSGGYHGQIITIRVKQSAGGANTLAFNAIYRFGLTAPSPTLTATASKWDVFLFKYDATDVKWDCLSYSQAF